MRIRRRTIFVEFIIALGLTCALVRALGGIAASERPRVVAADGPVHQVAPIWRRAELR